MKAAHTHSSLLAVKHMLGVRVPRVHSQTSCICSSSDEDGVNLEVE